MFVSGCVPRLLHSSQPNIRTSYKRRFTASPHMVTTVYLQTFDNGKRYHTVWSGSHWLSPNYPVPLNNMPAELSLSNMPR
jgi:hypothetical protein